MWDLLIGELKKSGWPVNDLQAPKMQAILLDTAEFVNVTNQAKAGKQTQNYSELEWGARLIVEEKDGLIIPPNLNVHDNLWTIFLLYDKGHPLDTLLVEIALIVEWNLKMKPGFIVNRLKKSGMKIGHLPKYGAGL